MSFPKRHIDFGDVCVPELKVTTAGSVHTEPDFKMGPRKIPDFGIVFLYAGTGWVVQAGKHHTLRGGELFLIYPNVLYAFAATTARWQVYYAHFTSADMAALLRRSGVTPREYLTRDIDRDEVRQWCEDIIREADASLTLSFHAPLQARDRFESAPVSDQPAHDTRASAPGERP